MLFVSHFPTRNNHHCSGDYFWYILWVKAQKRKPNLQQSSTNILRGANSAAKTAHSARERDTRSSLCFTLSHARLSSVIKLSIYPTPSQSPFQFLPLWTWQVIRMDYRESLEFLRISLHRQNTLTSQLVFFVFFSPLYYTQSAVVCRGLAVWLSKLVLIKALWRHDLSIFGSEAPVCQLSVWSPSLLFSSFWLLEKKCLCDYTSSDWDALLKCQSLQNNASGQSTWL